MFNARAQLAILAASAVVPALLFEAGLRAGGARYDSTFFVADRELGWALRPHAAGWQTVEGRQFVTTNAEGYRDRERSVRKPEGVYRIAVLGNSWTEAMQVPLDKTYPSLLEQLLPKEDLPHGARKLEVLNFAVSGYSTGQQLLQLRSRVWKHEPDLVLLALYTARDVANNVRALNNAATPEQSPYFLLSAAGLELDTSYRRVVPAGRVHHIAEELRFRAEDYCRACQFVNKLLRDAKVRIARARQDTRARRPGMRDLENIVYAPPSSAEAREAWDVTEALLREMDKDVRSHGARFWIVTLANRAQVELDDGKRSRILAETGAADFDYADRRLRDFGRAAGIPVTSLAEPLRAAAVRTGKYLNGFPNTAAGEGHWNELGHRFAAEVLAREFGDIIAGRDARTAAGHRMDRNAN
jgi:hypothetical protein